MNISFLNILFYDPQKQPFLKTGLIKGKVSLNGDIKNLSIIGNADVKNAIIPDILTISAKEKEGLDAFTSLIKEKFFSGQISFDDEVTISSLRQKEALSSALQSMKMVQQSLEDDMPEDFYSIDLMNAYACLGEIIGEEVGEDLVNEIFSKFCMGK